MSFANTSNDVADNLPPPLSFHSLITGAPALVRSFPLPTTTEQHHIPTLVAGIPADVVDAPIPEGTIATLIERAKKATSESKTHELKLNNRKEPKRGTLSRQSRKVFDALHGHAQDLRSQLPSSSNGVGTSTKKAAASIGEPLSDLSSTTTGMTLRPKKESVVPDVLLKKSARKEDAASTTGSKKAKAAVPEVAAIVKKEKEKVSNAKLAVAAKQEAAAVKELAATQKNMKISMDATAKLVNETPQSLIQTCLAAQDNESGNITVFDPRALSTLSNMLADAPAPFKELDADIVAKFVAHLVHYNTAATSSANTQTSSASQPPRLDEFSMALRTLTFFNCVSHPTFDKTWLADDSLDAAIDGLASIMRNVRKAVVKLTADDKTLPTDIVRLAECIRACCLGAAAIAFNTTVFSDLHLTRLEEIASSALVLHMEMGSEAPPKLCEELSRYIAASVSELYQALCAVSPLTSRGNFVESFLSKVHFSPNTARRTVAVGSESPTLVTTLAMAAVCCIQGLPSSEFIGGDNDAAIGASASYAEGTAVTDRCHNVARLWVNAIVSRFFSFDALKTSEAEEKEGSISLVAAFAEDLAAMLAIPQFPAADYLLRTLTITLVRTYLRAGGTTGSGALLEKLRATTVDILGKVAAKILHSQPEGAIEGGATEASVSESALQDWTVMMSSSGVEEATTTKSGKGGRSKKKEKKEAPPELSMAERIQCYAFHNYSQLSKGTRCSCSWMCARQYTTAMWCSGNTTHHDGTKEDPRKPPSFLKLAQQHPIQSSGSLTADTNKQLQSQIVFLMSLRTRSMLHSDGAEGLVQSILRTLKDDEDGASGSGWDQARKKAMMHIGKLLDIHPPLITAAWAVVRQCVCDDSARVRESSVALLQTLLHKVEDTITTSGTTETLTALGYNLISALLHLLSDRSTAVSTRAVAVVATSVANSITLANDVTLCRFVLTRLLSLFCVEGNEKQKVEICLIFAKRWFRDSGIAPSTKNAVELSLNDDSLLGGASAASLAADDGYSLLADELLHLALDGYAPPYEVGEDHPLAQLLRAVLATAEKNEEKPARGAAKGKRKELEVAKLAGGASNATSVIKGVVRYMLQITASPTPRHSPAAIMACLHVLACVHAEWVVPFMEKLQTMLKLPEQQDLAQWDEDHRICLLHTLRITRCALQQTTSVQQQAIASSLTQVLNRYVGMHQQKILLAAAGGLCAMIEPGTTSPGHSPNKVFLKAVYVLMNQYYHRTRALLGTMATDAAHGAYALRFMFLLSEFLRLYPWAKWNTELTTAETGTISNELASGPGILENAHRLSAAIAERSSAEMRQKTLTIVIRLVGSLCIQQPTEFFRRSENLLRQGLQFANDAALHVQALSVIKDFLVDEERRLNAAASAMDGGSSGAKNPVASPTGKGNSLSAALVAGKAEDQNSGMTTWVMQRFHKEIVALTLSKSSPCRQLAFEAVELAIHQGLLAPGIFAESVICLTAEPENGWLRARASKALHDLCERYDSAVIPKTVTGVIRGYDLIQRVHDEHGDPSTMATGYSEPTDVVPHMSVFESFFPFVTGCRKRREAFLGGLLRHFYQDGKLNEWTSARLKSTAGGNDNTKMQQVLEVEGSSVMAPVKMLVFLAGAIAFLPMNLENEALYILEQIRCGVDLIGEGCSQYLENIITKSPAIPNAAFVLELTKCAGTVLLLHLKTYLRKEYGITPAKIAKKQQNGVVGHSYLPQREPKSKAAVDFIKKPKELIRMLEPLVEIPMSDVELEGAAPTTKSGRKSGRKSAAVEAGWPSKAKAALQELQQTLDELLEEDSKDAMVLVNIGGQSPDERPLLKRRGRKAGAAGKTRRRMYRESDTSETDAESSTESSMDDE